ncbi:hypothetical protein BV25DRAFT_1450511 [Artomyces pyxidatus]|uniref:Uncharacterized protein n=1 Tax=Artomyces pyxidatus TaxID=48021 RepID=A0ACB8SMZ6_9AGAM|nr:hypothetical protein BV25DRAFT_1450511 [Artomyces pyxidatus]
MSFAAPKSRPQPPRRASSLPVLPSCKPSRSLSTSALLSVRKQIDEHKRGTCSIKDKENVLPPLKTARRVGSQRVSAAPSLPKLKPLTPTKPLHHTVPSATAARAGRSPRASPTPKRSSPAPGAWKAPSPPPTRNPLSARPAASIHGKRPALAPRRPLAPATPPRTEAAEVAASPLSENETSVDADAFFLDLGIRAESSPYRSRKIGLFAHVPGLQGSPTLVEHGSPIPPTGPASPLADSASEHDPLFGAFGYCEPSADAGSDGVCVESAIVCLDGDGAAPVFEAPAAWREACARRSSLVSLTSTTPSSPSGTSSFGFSPGPTPPPTRAYEKKDPFSGMQRLWSVFGGKYAGSWAM